MASVSNNKKSKERTLQFVLDGKRRSIWLGKMSKRDVLTWKSHVEELVAAKMQSNRAPYDATSQWVAGLDPSLHKKLVKVGDEFIHILGIYQAVTGIAKNGESCLLRNREEF